MNKVIINKQVEAIFRYESGYEPAQRKPYFVKCEIGERVMSARVSVVSNSSECEVSEFDILCALYNKGIRFGLDYKKIESIVSDKKFNRELTVAAGVEPEAGEDAELLPQVELEEFTTAELARQFPGQRVRKGVPIDIDQPIITKRPAGSGTPGYTVKGFRLATKPGADVEFEIGENVTVSPDGLKLLATIPGLAGLAGGKVEVRDTEYDAWKYQVHFRKNNMEAVLAITPGLSGKPVHDENWLNSQISEHNIGFGVERDAYRSIPDPVRSTCVITIAKGEPPLPGEDAEIIEHYRDGAGADDVFYKVGRDQLIAEKKPPGKGAKGRDVLDNPAEPPAGKDISFDAGKNVSVSANGLKIAAELDGYVVRRGNKFSVVECMEMDPSAGELKKKINFDGMVLVRGSLPPGHTIIASGHIEIQGDVTESNVVAGGNLRIAGKVIGCEKTKVQAVGDIHVGGIEGSRIRTDRGNVFMKTGAEKSEIIAGGRVEKVGEGECNVAGGMAVAGGGISLDTVGDVRYTPTIVCTGITLPVKIRYEYAMNEITRLIAGYKPVAVECLKLEKLIAAGKVDAGVIDRYKKLRIVRFALREKIRITRANIEKISAAVSVVAAGKAIVIKKYMYPGTIINIGIQRKKIEARLNSCAITMSEDGAEPEIKRMKK